MWNPNKNQTLSLIEDLRQETCLYDESDPIHKNKTYRNECWEKLAAKHGCSADDVRSKVSSLRCYFRREYLKVQQGMKSKWFAYDPLLFMADQFIKRLDDADNGDEALQEQLPHDIKVAQIKGEPPSPPEIKSSAPSSKSLATSVQTSSSGYKRARKIDEYSYFAELIALKLRKLNETHIRTTAMQKINEILFEFEMEYMNNTPVKILDTSS